MKVSSYTASGLSTGTLPSMSLSIGSLDSTSRVVRSTRSQNRVRKKQLNYNPREISSAILRASKSQAAGRVAVQAKGKLANLMKCKGTGQYDEGELNIAIIHAKRMVRCAQMKTQNLRQEERDSKHYEKEAKEELRQEKNKVKARAAQKERNLEQKYNLERMQRIQKQKSEKRELIRRKKFHRSRERGKLNEADMEYLKQQMRGLREPYSSSGDTGVTLDLSMQAMQMTEVQMTEAQMEAQIEQEIAQQMAAVEGMTGAEGMGAATVEGSGGTGAASSVAVPSIDVMV